MDIRLQQTPVVAIVGRPNVGKSTLFNRLLEKRLALVSAESGTTRDLKYGHFHWGANTFTAIDTAGLDLTSKSSTEADLKRQAQSAMHKADLILLIVDVSEGLLPQDRALARDLLKSKKPVLLVANKSDSPKMRRLAEAPEWLRLGLGDPHPISAANGSGVGDLLDVMKDIVIERKLDVRPLPPIDSRIAIVGRPNVGKSSLLNALAGEERVIVSEVPHTTKEPQDTLLTYEKEDGTIKNILLVDTVGIRKRRKVGPGMEKIGVDLSLEEVKRSDVALLMIDAAAGIGVQERKLANAIEELKPGVLIVVNKWDLTDEKQLGKADDYRRYVANELPAWTWAPVCFISALTGRNVGRIIAYALDIATTREREIATEDLDAFVEKLKKQHHSAFKKGEKRPKVFGLRQTGVKPPTFTLVVKDEATIHQNFLRFVENRIRDQFNFEGTPVRIIAREIER